MTKNVYSGTQKALHWITAALVVILAGSGMANFYDVGGDFPMTAHQIGGQLLLVVLLLRIVTRVKRPVAVKAGHRRWENGAATLMHGAMYLVMAAYVATGYVAASAFSDPELLMPVDRAFARSDIGDWLLEAHYSLKWVLLAMVSLHVLAVIKHGVFDRDATFSRMWFQKG